MLCDAGSKLYLFQESFTLRGEFAQGILKVDIAEAGAADLGALDGCAAPIAGRLLGVGTNDGADRAAVLEA